MNELPDNEIRRMLTGAVPPLREPEDRLGQIRARVRRSRLRAGAAATGGVTVVAALALAVPQLVAGPASGPDSPAEGDSELRYQGNVLVIETPEHGPRLCAAAPVQPLIDDGGGSQPPCNGPANVVVDWDWDVVHAESAGGATWGTYFLVGTWGGERFTLTEPPRPPDPELEAPNSVDDGDLNDSPCPSGGLRPADLSKATQEAFDDVSSWAAGRPEYAGIWIDQSYIDDLDADDYEYPEEMWNDPQRFVLNLRFVGDPAQWEARVRERWGGALCVTSAQRTQQELSSIVREVVGEHPFPETLNLSEDLLANAVAVEVLVATPELQQGFDERYGAGAVIVEGWLEPVG